MGREVRRVPPTWQHPKDYRNRYVPMHDDSFEERMLEWIREGEEWLAGKRPDYCKDEHPSTWRAYAEYNGGAPQVESYMPDWPLSQRTHYQMYENVSEGTPISPVMESPEALARWLADNRAPASGTNMTATYDQWLRVCKGGYAPSLVISGGRMMSGVEGLSEPAAAHPEPTP